MWSCLLFLSLPVYSCKFLSQPLGSFVLAPSPLQNDRNIYRKSHAWIYAHHKSLPRKIVSFFGENNTSSKKLGGPSALPYQKSHFWYKEKWSPLGTRCRCLAFARKRAVSVFGVTVSAGLLQFKVVKISIKNSHNNNNNKKCLKIGKTTLILQFASNSFFRLDRNFGRKKISSYSHVPSEFSLRSSLSSHVRIRAAWLKGRFTKTLYSSILRTAEM